MAELIFNQGPLSGEEYRYGLRPSSATGCGWVATYNALVLLGRDTDKQALIRYFAWQLPLIHGNLGTSFFGPALCFRQWGFPVKLVKNRRRYDAEAGAADVSILFYHWRRGARLGAHFVAVEKTETGFVGYNTFSNSTGPDPYGPSLEGFLQSQGWFGTALIAIRDKP